MPYFPADDYGFTKQDRLHWAPYAVDYLVNRADISYLGDLKFEDGSPLYNERELTHMQDVKRVTQNALQLWDISLVTLLLLGLWAWRANWMPAYTRGFWRGGWLMVGLAFTIGTIVVVGIAVNPDVFWEFFTLFHKLILYRRFLAVLLLRHPHPPLPHPLLAGCISAGGGHCSGRRTRSRIWIETKSIISGSITGAVRPHAYMMYNY